jgi:uncharacterized protein (DUF111 family)
MNLHSLGLGAGTQPLPIPNILRLWLGEKAETSVSQHHHAAPTPDSSVDNLAKNLVNSLDPLTNANLADRLNPSQQLETPEQVETIAVLETQIDDLSPQAISYACDRLFQVGALDVFTQGITMKKSRLGTLLTVITPLAKVPGCEAVLFQETSTLGIRRSIQERSILQREIQTVTTEYGTVRVKVAWWGDRTNIMNVQPEYEDCAAIARSTNLPWQQIHTTALQTWQKLADVVE